MSPFVSLELHRLKLICILNPVLPFLVTLLYRNCNFQSGFLLRVQDTCDDRDTPDSFVPSSSPESVMGVEISRYPDLSAVKEEVPERIASPIIPILPTSAGKGNAKLISNGGCSLLCLYCPAMSQASSLFT